MSHCLIANTQSEYARAPSKPTYIAGTRTRIQVAKRPGSPAGHTLSVRTALAASLNVPPVRTIGIVSPDAFHRQLRDLDLPLKETGQLVRLQPGIGQRRHRSAAPDERLSHAGQWRTA